MTNTFDKKQRDIILERLNSYIISLKVHILEIVHSESEEFLSLAASLAQFNKNFESVKFLHG